MDRPTYQGKHLSPEFIGASIKTQSWVFLVYEYMGEPVYVHVLDNKHQLVLGTHNHKESIFDSA